MNLTVETEFVVGVYSFDQSSSLSVLLPFFAVLDTKLEFRQGHLRNETTVCRNIIKFHVEIELALHIKNGNVRVDQVLLQNGSICLVNTRLPRSSPISSSADLVESNAPNAFLKDDFLLVKSFLTDSVSLAIRSSLSLGVKLVKSLM